MACSLCLDMVEGVRELREVSYKNANLIREASTLMAQAPPKGFTSKAITRSIRVRSGNLGGYKNI